MDELVVFSRAMHAACQTAPQLLPLLGLSDPQQGMSSMLAREESLAQALRGIASTKENQFAGLEKGLYAVATAASAALGALGQASASVAQQLSTSASGLRRMGSVIRGL